jgi:hypothetical protein
MKDVYMADNPHATAEMVERAFQKHESSDPFAVQVCYIRKVVIPNVNNIIPSVDWYIVYCGKSGDSIGWDGSYQGALRQVWEKGMLLYSVH